jgi:succinate dehydrogenase / fumarate reductase cytochrome b subunit
MLRAVSARVEWRRLGFWVWMLRRVSGLGIAFYLLLHIVVIHQLVAGRATFDQAMDLFASPAFRLGELAVVVACIVHAVDGVRVMAIEAFDLARAERRMLWLSATVASVAVALGGTPLLLHLLGLRLVLP